MLLLRELLRRRVLRFAGIYLIGAWLVLQIADVTFEPLGLPEWSMTALVWIAVAGFAVALLLSWRYDIGEDGLVRVTPNTPDAPHSPLTAFDYALLAGSVVAVVLFGWAFVDNLMDMPTPVAPVASEHTVAVLPFANRSQDPSLNYFGDGIAEQVTNRLSLVDGLSILAYTASFGVADPRVDPREVGRQLAVRYLVSGSVRAEGDLLRVNAQLIEAESRVQFWSVESGPVDRFDAFEIQATIASGVTSAMRTKLGLEQSEPIVEAGAKPDSTAYDLYLKGRSIWFRRGNSEIGEAVDHLAEAVRIDPGFARAWAALASAYLTWPGYSAAGYRTWWEAKPAAEKAIALDAMLAEPHAVIASVARAEGRWLAADRGFRRALELDADSATSHYWYSEHLAMTGRYRESVRHLTRVLELDPTYMAPRTDAIFALLHYGEIALAQTMVSAAWGAGERSPATAQAAIIANVMAGDLDGARRIIATLSLPQAQVDTLSAFLEVEAGDADLADAMDRLEAEPAARPDYRLLVWFAARLGALDYAMSAMNARVERGSPVETRVLWGPGHQLVGHPDFEHLVDAIGLVQYWRQTQPADFCRFENGQLACDERSDDLPGETVQFLVAAVDRLMRR